MPADAYLARGTRVAIRHVDHADQEEFLRLANESVELHRPWLFPPTTPEAFEAFLTKLGSPAAAGFLVCEPDSGRIAGFININNIVQNAFRCGAVGYGVFTHAAGRGVMSEGLGLVVGYAFGPMGLHRLEANIQPGNEASQRLVERYGFRLEGYSPDFLFINGAWRDHERWAITSEMVGTEPGEGPSAG
ncbi:GNAT family protein [Streptomyces sp. NPDC004647]|uniref:GNAT family N-acetyltransferase n=1 Tax=Streptomyces sp. NPDC004647 TaxID=3154671 RepID=UPI00339E706E